MPHDALPSGWERVIITLIVGVPAYIVLMRIYRRSGKRSLTEMNTFELFVIVTHAIILGTMLLSESFALTDGIASLVLLFFVQFGVTWLSARFKPMREVERFEPSLLYHKEAFMDKAMQRQHVSRDEVLEVVRSKGMSNMTEVDFVIMETDGNFSVLPESQRGSEKMFSGISPLGSHYKESI